MIVTMQDLSLNGTCARDSVSSVSHMTRAVERDLGVGTGGVRVTVVSSSDTFVNI